MASISFLLNPKSLALVFSLLLLTSHSHALSDAGNMLAITRSSNRRLMRYRRGGGGDVGFVRRCKASDLVITQAVGRPLSNGIPTYSVQICSTCQSNCRIRSVHVSCGLFASAKLVNPRIFRRVGPNNCVVNDGKPLESGATLSFVYANSFSYPMAVTRAKMC